MVSFDEGVPDGSFAARLAKDNGWMRLYTLRVLNEYKKFVFLVIASKQLTVASDAVDQVWHQHILFAESWARFCAEVLGHQLNHEPARPEPTTGIDSRKDTNTHSMAHDIRHQLEFRLIAAAMASTRGA